MSEPEPEKVLLEVPPESLAKIQAGEAVPFAWRNEKGEDVLLIVPTVWSEEERKEAILSLGPGVGSEMDTLAIISLLRTSGNKSLAIRLLEAGWSPHEAFAVPE